MNELEQKLMEYEKAFHNSFPTYPLLLERTDKAIIEMIDKCLDEEKDVYEMGYLSDDIEIKY